MAKTIQILLAVLIFPVVAWAQPRLVFDHTENDFGRVYQNEKFDHIFPFTNTGDQPLIIQKVKGT